MHRLTHQRTALQAMNVTIRIVYMKIKGHTRYKRAAVKTIISGKADNALDRVELRLQIINRVLQKNKEKYIVYIHIN